VRACPELAADEFVHRLQLLNAVSGWILLRKVRSHALLFVFRYYYFLVYHVFYRNLFARLRSPDQAAYITLLSSSVVVVWYPLSMSKTVWRLLRWSTGLEQDWAEYAASKGEELYLRNLSESVTSASPSLLSLSFSSSWIAA